MVKPACLGVTDGRHHVFIRLHTPLGQALHSEGHAGQRVLHGHVRLRASGGLDEWEVAGLIGLRTVVLVPRRLGQTFHDTVDGIVVHLDEGLSRIQADQLASQEGTSDVAGDAIQREASADCVGFNHCSLCENT